MKLILKDLNQPPERNYHINRIVITLEMKK
jgi:hypothetical protein